MLGIYVWGESSNLHGILEQFELVNLVVLELLTAAIFLNWYIVSIILMRTTTHSSTGRGVAMAAILPMLWYLCLWVAAVPVLIVIYGSLVVLSFR